MFLSEEDHLKILAKIRKNIQIPEKSKPTMPVLSAAEDLKERLYIGELIFNAMKKLGGIKNG